jgi:hypothetical protein
VTVRWLVPIVAVGALLRFVPVWFGLPYMQARPDEDVAINLAVHTLTDLNPHFFHWPSLTLYVFGGVIGVARLIGIVPDPSPSIGPEHFILTRTVIAAAGTVTAEPCRVIPGHNCRRSRSRPDAIAGQTLEGIVTRPPRELLPGYGRDSDVEAALEAGFDDHVTKPPIPRGSTSCSPASAKRQPPAEPRGTA